LGTNGLQRSNEPVRLNPEGMQMSAVEREVRGKVENYLLQAVGVGSKISIRSTNAKTNKHWPGPTQQNFD
jgi:hypothetical protein